MGIQIIDYVKEENILVIKGSRFLYNSDDSRYSMLFIVNTVFPFNLHSIVTLR